MRKLVSYEKHYDEGSSQASVYLKITFFRWINAVIVTRYITPILVTLGSNSWDLIPTLSVLLISGKQKSLSRNDVCETKSACSWRGNAPGLFDLRWSSLSFIMPWCESVPNLSYCHFWWKLQPSFLLIRTEMFVSPLLRYFDVMSIIKRHYFAPRAKTEEQMFACFNGGWYNLAERFTDFTKVLLLCTFYSAFYPVIYFLGAVRIW